MTYSYTTYEFTAFTEADLLQGTNGSNLGCGDTFTMPATATTCISVKDDDGSLSGDSCYNENADDWYGQNASIMGAGGGEKGNGGQIYAESYYWVHDQNGNWYVMIEIEQEGTSDDYFTFYTGGGYSLPPAGAELTVYSQCNVSSNWIDYDCLGAGEKTPETGSISGTVFCDIDCDGINGEKKIIPGCDYTVEAEHMYEYGFKTVYSDTGSGGKIVRLECAGSDAALYTYFKGKTGTYDLKIRVQDECDGQSMIKVLVGGQLVDAIRLDGDNNGGGSDHGSFSTYVIKDVDISYGEKVKLQVWGDGYEMVRIDKIDFEGQDEVIYEQEPVKEGVTVKLLDAHGNVVAETTTDENGNYRFDDVLAGDYKIMGVAPDGTEFTIQDVGSDDSIDSDVDANGMSGVVTVAGGSETDIDLGVCEKPSAAICGRYFCDENRNDRDDGEPGVEGAKVWLIQVGVGVVAMTTTGPDGTYAFEGLEAGDYRVRFEDPADVPGAEGKTFVTANVGDDVDDSDVTSVGGAGNGNTDVIILADGQKVENVDAGVEDLPGALSGTYFCDDDRDGVDDGAASGDADIAGKMVMLFEADGLTPATDIDGNPVAAVLTDAQGNYRFDNLAAGDYVVMFEDSLADGKTFVAPNVGSDDTIDSDVVHAANGKTAPVTVVAGQETKDVDAGVEDPNDDPEPMDDQAKTCADETVMVDVLANDGDPDGDALTITMVDGQAIGDGQTIMTLAGTKVTLSGGKLVIDGETAYASLDIGQEANETISYKVSDGNGGSATANLEMTFCGDANSVASLAASLPTNICFEIPPIFPVQESLEGYFDAILSGSGDSRFDGITVTNAFCLDYSADFAYDVEVKANVTLATAEAASAAGLKSSIVENLDLINWILNQDFGSLDNGDGDGRTYRDAEIQGAIWALTDNNPFVADGAGTVLNALEILALANDPLNEGYVPGEGDVIGILLDPLDGQEFPDAFPDEAFAQPFILGIEFEDIDCLCSSDTMIL